MTTVVAKKSYKDGHVSVHVVLKARGWQSDSVKIEGNTDLTSAEARALGQSLIDAADRADAKVAAKQASEDRRNKWRDREIASGRIKVMSIQSILGR